MSKQSRGHNHPSGANPKGEPGPQTAPKVAVLLPPKGATEEELERAYIALFPNNPDVLGLRKKYGL